MNMHSWFAIQVKPKREKKVASLLEIKGYGCLCPTYRVTKSLTEPAGKSELPLFPGYIFCSVSTTSFGKIVTTPGVVRMLGFGPKPCQIPDEEMLALQRVQESSIPRTPWAFLTVGARVRITSGPLFGIEGVYSGESDHRKLILSVNLLQRSVAVQLDCRVDIEVVHTRNSAMTDSVTYSAKRS